MSVTLSVSKLTDDELRTIGEKHEDEEELESITKEIDNDKYREGLLQRQTLTEDLLEYILKTKNEEILKKLAEREYNTREIEEKLYELNSEAIDNCLLMNAKLHQETLEDLYKRYFENKYWIQNILFHSSVGDYILEKEYNKIKELSFDEIMHSEEILLRIAEKITRENILEELANIEEFLKNALELKKATNVNNNVKKEDNDLEIQNIKRIVRNLHLKLSGNSSLNEKILHFLAKSINVNELDEELIEKILTNPKTSGFTIAYIVTIFFNVGFPQCTQYLRKKSSEILKIISNNIDNV